MVPGPPGCSPLSLIVSPSLTGWDLSLLYLLVFLFVWVLLWGYASEEGHEGKEKDTSAVFNLSWMAVIAMEGPQSMHDLGENRFLGVIGFAARSLFTQEKSDEGIIE